MKSVLICSLLLFTIIGLATGQHTDYPEKKGQPSSNRLEKEKLSEDQVFFRKVAREMRYPATAQQGMKVGKVYAEFVVDREGKIASVSVLNAGNIDPALGQEVVRTISGLPEQNPAYAGSYVLPVSFQLESKSSGTIKAPEKDTVAMSETLKTKFVLQDMIIVGYK